MPRFDLYSVLPTRRSAQCGFPILQRRYSSEARSAREALVSLFGEGEEEAYIPVANYRDMAVAYIIESDPALVWIAVRHPEDEEETVPQPAFCRGERVESHGCSSWAFVGKPLVYGWPIDATGADSSEGHEAEDSVHVVYEQDRQNVYHLVVFCWLRSRER